MNRFRFVALNLLLFVFTTTHFADAEIIASWDRVVMTSNELNFPIEVKAQSSGGKLAELLIRVGDVEVKVPDKDLDELESVHLSSLKLGYWDKKSKNFYVSIVCGVTSSFPLAKQPFETFFEFREGSYTGKRSLPVPGFVGG